TFAASSNPGRPFLFKRMFLTDALLSVFYPQSCRMCGRSVEQRRLGVVCETCWKTQIFTDQGSVGWYEGALRETVLLLKRQPYLPPYVVELIGEACKSFAGVTRVVPVPLHEERLRSRGFNQAAIIAREMSRVLRVPLDENSLVRVASSEKHRTGLDAKGRWDSVAKAFTVRYPRLIAGESILLVDDVFTTGATVRACETALESAGAKSTAIFVLAKARR
ncbi:MAG TPA: phosphoribosyltransferase family protein, partial [Pyrinomonadaceae bacterium]|nr:phosphoribosyltransferase family protein [Pyrinomonadaceae bacterium]